MFKFEDERQYAYPWRNNGQLPTGEPGEVITVEDAIAVPNASMWLPKVIENIVKEAVEPTLVGPALLQRVEYHFGQTISFPAVGALEAADIPEEGSYPERQLSMGGATVTAHIGKSGLAVKITEEMIRYSQYDVIQMHLRAAGRALARHKEKKIFNYINSMGAVCFDNLNPTNSFYGVTTGRALDGTANGSAVLDDIFDTYSQILLQGFIPDTLLLHPLTWSMFVKDPVMRLMMLNGAGNTFFATHRGNVASRAPWDASGQGGMGVSGGQNITQGGAANGGTATAIEGYSQTMSSAPNLPGYFPYPFRIIVSPFVRFDTASKLTDIMLFDSSELGALIVDEEVTTDEWTDPSVDIRKIKLRERYGIGIFNEGMGIGVMKNVKVTPNQIVLPAQATQDVSGSIASISATTALSL